MSGGSFQYLYRAETLELPGMMETLVAMQKTLAQLGYANDVAGATQTVIDRIKAAQEKLNERTTNWELDLQEADERLGELRDIIRDEDEEREFQTLTTLVNDIKEAETSIGEVSAPLFWVWKGVEWWHSFDSSEQGFKDILAQHRAPAQD